jgi:opacity protein-like surface antigen
MLLNRCCIFIIFAISITKYHFIIMIKKILLLPITLTLIFQANYSLANSKYFYNLGISSNKINQSTLYTDKDNDNFILTNPNVVTDTSTLSIDKIGYYFSLGLKKNLNNFLFIAPTISYERMDASNRDNFNFKYKYNDRIIAMIKVGVNINNNLSLYPLIGISDVGYSVDGTAVNNSFRAGLNPKIINDYGSFSNRDSSLIYGIGLSLKLHNNHSLQIEYSKQELDIRSEHKSILQGITSANISNDIESIKIGISSNF